MRLAQLLTLVAGLALLSCLAQAASAASLVVAASDSSNLVKSQADYICDGTSDQVEINKALAALPSGGTVVLSAGHYTLNGNVVPKSSTNLKGEGEDATFLNFVSSASISLSSTNNVKVSDLQINGKGRVYISSSHHVIENVKVYNVDNSYMAAFIIYAYSKTVEDIQFINCKAIDCDRWGFVHNGGGWGTPSVVKNITYTDCQAINCGRYDQYYGENHQYGEAWDVGFDIAEYIDTVQDVTYTRCIAEGTWESGFHSEPPPTLKNVKLIDCVSRDNGQKQKTGASHPDFGAGYIVMEGMTLQNCVSEDNIVGFMCDYPDSSSITGSSDKGSLIGFRILSVGSGGLKIESSSVTNSPEPVLFLAGGSKVSMNGLNIASSTSRSTAGIRVQSKVSSPSSILVANSKISGYATGINNQASANGLVQVSNVEVTGAKTNFIGTKVIGAVLPPTTTPTPTPTPTPTVTPTPTPTSTVTPTVTPTPTPTAEPTPQPTPEPSNGKDVLLITGNSYLNPGDTAMKDNLESQGYTVTTKEDTLVTAADAEDKDVVIISSSLNGGSVGTTLKDVAVPVISCEAWVFDDLKMTGTSVGTDYSAAAGQTQVAIADAASPLAAGLTGTVRVTGTAGYEMYGLPSADATKVATVVGQPDQATVFAYDTGAEMVGMKAPAPRVGFFLHDQVAASTTPDGWALFDAAVKWAVDAGDSTEVSPTPEPTTEPTPEPTSGPSEPAKVLLITGYSYLNPGDKAMKNNLESQGYTVTTKEDTLVTAADAEDKDVVIISSSLNGGDVGTTLRNVAVPVISCEAWVFDDLKMTGTSRGTDYSAAAGQTQVAIADAASPLAAGLTGTVKVTSTAGSEMYGLPSADATKVATVVGQPKKVTVFAYDTGAEMVGMKAPAPRVGFFLHDQVAASTTPDGWALFDAAVKWAIAKA